MKTLTTRVLVSLFSVFIVLLAFPASFTQAVEGETVSLTVTKVVNNENGGTAEVSDFILQYAPTAGGTPVQVTSGETVIIPVNDYTISEVQIPGYEMIEGTNCSITGAGGGTNPGESDSHSIDVFSLSAGSIVNCTFVNVDQPASLTIVVNTTDGQDGDVFNFTAGSASPTVTTTGGTGTTNIVLDAGDYPLAQEPKAGWSLGTPSCIDEATSATVDPSTLSLAVGMHVICTVANARLVGSDLSIDKSVDNANPKVGETLVYTLTVSNGGPESSPSMVISDVLPAGLTYVSDDGAGAFATSTGNWSVPSLANGASATLHITVTVNAGTEGQTINNTGTIATRGEGPRDPNPGNDTDTVPVTVFKPDNGGGNPGGGGSGCGVGFTFNRDTRECDRNGGGGQVLGTSTPQVLGESCGLYMEQHLIKGSPNNNPAQVTKLQQFLNKHGYANFTPTGYYGDQTVAAVNAFQTKYASEILTPWKISAPTGIVYFTTLRWINMIECPELGIKIPPLKDWSANTSPQPFPQTFIY